MILKYNTLEHRYKNEMVTISKQDEEELIDFANVTYSCNSTAQDFYRKLNMNNGLSKIITFGVGINGDRGAQETWCYEEIFYEDRAVYKSNDMTWERWSNQLIKHLQKYLSLKNYSLDNFNISLYYQDGVRLTLNRDTREIIEEWKNSYINGEISDFPFNGLINTDNKEFIVYYDTDFEYKDR